MTVVTAFARSFLRAYLPEHPHAVRVRGDRGEGVISAAIAVLIMAFLGAAMWVGFNQIWRDAETNTSDQVNQIGN